jgi:hypothetical protein
MEAHSSTQKWRPHCIVRWLTQCIQLPFISGGLAGLSMAMYDETLWSIVWCKQPCSYWSELGVRLIEAGADALYVANDMGMNGSTIISPDQLREFFLPRVRQAVPHMETGRGRLVLHSCGANVMAILEDLGGDGR